MAVSRYLSAFTKAPNRGNETFYLFSSHFNYGAMLSGYTATDIGSLDISNYRANEGKIKLTGTHLIVDFRKVVYFHLYDYDDVTSTITNHSYYFVERAYIESGYFVYDIKPDIWANEIANANFTQFHITRCNRELGNGVYDEVKLTKGYKFDYYYNGALNRPINEYCVVFSASVVLQASWFGQNPLTQSFLFYMPLEDIANAAVATYQNLDILEKVRFVIGGMHSANTNSGTDAKMQVVRCWILPKTAAKPYGLALSGIKTKSVVTGNSDYTFASVALVKPWEHIENYDFTTFLGTYLSTRYPDYHVEFGTRGHTLPLTRYTSDKQVFARYFITSGGVRVQVEQGNNVLDVSDAFELDINVNNQVGTSTQELAKNAAKLLALFTLSSKAYAKGGMNAAAITAISGVLGMREGGTGSAPATFNGDASTTFGLNDPDYLMFPFVVAATPSNENEDEAAYFKGASYDAYNDDFATIETYTHLGSVATALEREGTLIASDDFKVTGVSMDAENAMREAFKRGIWLKVLQ